MSILSTINDKWFGIEKGNMPLSDKSPIEVVGILAWLTGVGGPIGEFFLYPSMNVLRLRCGMP